MQQYEQLNINFHWKAFGQVLSDKHLYARVSLCSHIYSGFSMIIMLKMAKSLTSSERVKSYIACILFRIIFLICMWLAESHFTLHSPTWKSHSLISCKSQINLPTYGLGPYAISTLPALWVSLEPIRLLCFFFSFKLSSFHLLAVFVSSFTWKFFRFIVDIPCLMYGILFI